MSPPSLGGSVCAYYHHYRKSGLLTRLAQSGVRSTARERARSRD